KLTPCAADTPLTHPAMDEAFSRPFSVIYHSADYFAQGVIMIRRQSCCSRVSVRLGLLLSPAWLWAQGSSVGSITGVVNDPTGSAIPGAAVTIRNVNTNQDRQTSTSGSGVYSVTSLPV